MTSPSVSPVVLVSPSASVARYDLVASMRKRENLVASPKTSGSRPVAKGSRVPVWPALRAASRRLARASAWVDENPGGLSSSRIPSGWAPVTSRLPGARLACRRGRLHRLVDEAREPNAALDRLVVGEMQLGDLADGE